MSRQLQTYVLTLTLEPSELAALADQDWPELDRSPTDDAVAWELAESSEPQGWADFAGRSWRARATLPLPIVTEADWDANDNGPRTASTGRMVAEACRAWQALEIHDATPTGTSITYRLHDGITAWWWTGAAWAIPSNPLTHWSTAQQLQDNLATWPSVARSFQVTAWLKTTVATARPSFFGATVAYGCAERGPTQDAHLRTLRRQLATLEAVGVMEFTTTASTASIRVPPEEWQHDVRAIDAVYDLTADPDEQTPLTGVWASPTWTPTTPIATAHLVLVEFRHRPLVTSQGRYRQATPISRLPAIYLTDQGLPETLRGANDLVIMNRFADPPVAKVLPALTQLGQDMQIRILSELETDASAIAQAVRAWLGAGGYRSLISQETGQTVEIRLLDDFAAVPDGLRAGVVDLRGRVRLTYRLPVAQTLVTQTLVEPDGVVFGAEEE